MDLEPDQTNTEELRFDDLLIRYWDDNIDERGWAELQASLAARPELRARFNEMGLQTLAISERLAAEKIVNGETAPSRSRLIGRFVPYAIAAGILIAAGLALFDWRSKPGEDAVAHLQDFAGTIYVGEVGAERPLAVNQPLTPGQIVSTVGANSSAEIRCADGTRLLLSGDTSVALAEKGTENIRLKQGDMGASVPPRPEGSPLRIFTPGTEVEAGDAKLSLTTSDKQTLVGVSEAKGAVRMKRLSDGQSVPLRPGQWAATYAQSDLKPRALPSLADTRLFEFNAGLPAGWLSGKLVSDNLPEGSQAAVRAMPYPHHHGTWYKVQSQKDWTNGLFAIHDDSVMHVRFRVEKPGFFHTLVVARDPDPTRRLCVVLEQNRFWQKRQPDQWYTVDLPFADFRPTQPGTQLDKPLVAFIVLFDSQKLDQGLTIDRFWITRGTAP